MAPFVSSLAPSTHSPVGHTQDIEEDPEDEEEDRESGRGISKEEEEDEEDDDNEENVTEGLDLSKEIFEEVHCELYVYSACMFNCITMTTVLYPSNTLCLLTSMFIFMW